MSTLVYIVAKKGKSINKVYGAIYAAITKLSRGKMDSFTTPRFGPYSMISIAFGESILTKVPYGYTRMRRLIQVVDFSDDHIHYIETFVDKTDETTDNCERKFI